MYNIRSSVLRYSAAYTSISVVQSLHCAVVLYLINAVQIDQHHMSAQFHGNHHLSSPQQEAHETNVCIYIPLPCRYLAKHSVVV